MRVAALSRGGAAAQRAGFRAAAGAVGALFVRSYARADAIQRAMLARGFTGRFPSLGAMRFTVADGVFAVCGGATIVLVRALSERLAG